MTRVMIKAEPGRYDITVIGHAEKVNAGEGNILCAAVSVLAQTLIQMVRDAEENHLLRHSEMILDGNVRIVCTYQPGNDYIDGMFDTIETGFLLLQSKYEKNLLVVGESKKRI